MQKSVLEMFFVYVGENELILCNLYKRQILTFWKKKKKCESRNNTTIVAFFTPLLAGNV